VAPPGAVSGSPLGGGGAGDAQEPPPPLNVQLPPPPDLPPLPKGEAPPVAVIGVMGVPEVMRASAAAQQVEKVIGERRNKLNEDAQKEQAAWRDMQQSLANDRAKLSSEQVRARERELQERITNAQRQFRDRNRIIQEAAQYALAQIERTLIAVIRQVAEARGMNLVLHRAQVALNVNQFDITDQVTEQLNKILPTVLIPPDGVSPVPPPLAKGPTAATPATAPAAPTPAPAAAPAAPAQ
jgi:Skp family chaperone for outer membrane proteins